MVRLHRVCQRLADTSGQDTGKQAFDDKLNSLIIKIR